MNISSISTGNSSYPIGPSSGAVDPSVQNIITGLGRIYQATKLPELNTLIGNITTAATGLSASDSQLFLTGLSVWAASVQCEAQGQTPPANLLGLNGSGFRAFQSIIPTSYPVGTKADPLVPLDFLGGLKFAGSLMNLTMQSGIGGTPEDYAFIQCLFLAATGTASGGTPPTYLNISANNVNTNLNNNFETFYSGYEYKDPSWPSGAPYCLEEEWHNPISNAGFNVCSGLQQMAHAAGITGGFPPVVN